MEEGIAYAIWLLIHTVLLHTGKAVVAVLSLGRWRGEKLAENEGRIYSAAGAMSFKRNGQRVITATPLAFLGLAFYFALGILLFKVTTA
jgi:hypothetical protein